MLRQARPKSIDQNVARWEVVCRRLDCCAFSGGCGQEATCLTRNVVGDSSDRQPVDCRKLVSDLMQVVAHRVVEVN